MVQKLTVYSLFIYVVLTSQILAILPFYELIFDSKSELVELLIEDSTEKEEEIKDRIELEHPMEYVISDHISTAMEFKMGAYKFYLIQVETPPPEV